jgi:hypothetical protein
MPPTIRSLIVALLLVVIATSLAFAWGRSWAEVPECASGSYHLADAGWVFQGMALGLVVGIVVPITLAVLRSFLLAVPAVVVAGAAMLHAGNLGNPGGSCEAPNQR